MAKFQDNPITLKSASGSCPAYRVVSPSAVGNHYAGIHVTATSIILGVSQNDCSSTGQGWRIRINGTTKVTCGASVSAGAICIPQTATGKVVEGTKTYNTGTTAIPRSVGIALESGSTNSVIEMQIVIDNIRKQAFS